MNFPGKKVMPRYFVLAALLTLGGLAIIGRAAYMIAADKTYWLAVDSLNVKHDSILIYPMRGDILADGGEVLASSVPEYRIMLNFRTYEKDSLQRARQEFQRYLRIMTDLDTICHSLWTVFPDIDTVKLHKDIIEAHKQRHTHFSLYPRRITYIQFAKLLEQPFFNRSQGLTGFYWEEFEVRKKPFGSLAGRTVGDLNIDGRKSTPRTGIEYVLNDTLKGKIGYAHREKVHDEYMKFTDVEPENGKSVQTTLNITMQEICERALREKLVELQEQNSGEVHFGTCILMEVATGDIKAMVSLENRHDGSFLEVNDQAVTYRTEPGSVFKPMSFLVAFNDGYLHLDDVAPIGGGQKMVYGRRMTDWNWGSGGYGSLTAKMCIANSSNIGVSYFIDKYYKDNPQRFVDGIIATGVADDLEIPIPGYKKPRIKSPNRLLEGEYWAKTDLPWMSFGYVTQIAPINTLAFYNGIANGGRMMRPRLIKAYLQNGEVCEEVPPVVVREHMASDEAVKNIQECLRAVVTVGVGKRAGSKKVAIAGKTGTAQDWSGGKRSNAYFVTFAGYFPYENPKYSCIVCIKKSGAASGGGHCGPVFSKIAEMVLAQELHSDYQSAKDSTHVATPNVNSGNMRATEHVMREIGVNYHAQAGSQSAQWCRAECSGRDITLQGAETQQGNLVPDVTGYGLRDAVYCLERMGLRVKTVGRGQVVAQNLKPGHEIKAGEKIVLTLGRPKAESKAEADSIRHLAQTEVIEDEVISDETLHPDSSSALNASERPRPEPKKEPAKERKAPAATPGRAPSQQKQR